MANIDAFKQTLKPLYTVVIANEFGELGANTLARMIDKISEIYQYFDPENYRGKLLLVSDFHDNLVLPFETSSEVINIESISNLDDNSLIFQLFGNGSLRYWRSAVFDPNSFGSRGILYEYENNREYFYANGRLAHVPQFFSSQTSIFANSTFRSLDEAIEAYHIKSARYSNCPFLKQAWGDTNRIVLKCSPESLMRDSLTQFLHNRLRGNVEVRPEQNVDESHPVDIKVTWQSSNRRALIEIKWLGDSLNEDGNLGTSYRDARAREGAQQLANYLDVNKIKTPTHVTRGYLVIFDARRRGVKINNGIVSSNPLYYRDIELDLQINLEETRQDFNKPIRIFLEPNFGRYE